MKFEAMKKKVAKDGGKKVYLLGKNKEGYFYWLVEPSWDCGWYWGFGYVQSYEKNKAPEKAKDIDEFRHFDSLFFEEKNVYLDAFEEFFEETPLSRSEVWDLMELMKSAYTLRECAELVYRGSSNISSNSVSDFLKDENYYNKINKDLLPKTFEEIEKIMKGDN